MKLVMIELTLFQRCVITRSTDTGVVLPWYLNHNL